MPNKDLNDFQSCFENHYNFIYNFFYFRNFSDEDARDFTQETFLNAFKSFDSFRGDAKARTWLFKIATNVLRNSIRASYAAKRNAQVVLLDDTSEKDFSQFNMPSGLTEEKAGPLREILKKEEINLLYQTLTKLPPQMRRCVMLKLGKQLKYKEIAIIMRLSIGTVKALLYQARQRMKEMMGDYYSGYNFISPKNGSEESGASKLGGRHEKNTSVGR